MDFNARYIAARRAAIEKDYMDLNPEQRRAVMATEGPLLILAGAGSGKTTVLIHRVANLLTYGCGADTDEVPESATEDDLAFLENYPDSPSPNDRARARKLCAVRPAEPWSIVAITFTNKAANELRERLEKRLGTARAEGIWAFTFHSACVRILRRDIEKIGFSSNFTIYDSQDSQRVIKDIVKEMGMSDREFPARMVLSAISRSKDDMVLPEEYAEQWGQSGDWQKERIAKIYKEYVKRLRDANALDFDDIILHTVTLLRDYKDVREYYQNKFKYVLIDEYQDTNHLQYLLASYLAGGRKNICVVGDDDQSIYRFRGANIENILNFEKQYKNARTIRLEQNYRSTQNILDAANAVIRNNTGRKGKELWTGNGGGEKITVMSLFNEAEEANYVVKQIMNGGGKLGDSAVLYRINALSQQLERAFRANGIKPRVVGGQAFFERAEVKDMLAYLCVIDNPADDLRLRRIINSPPRGIGAKTIDNIQDIASREDVPMFQTILNAAEYPELSKAEARLADFAVMIVALQGKVEVLPLDEFYDEVCADTGYIKMLEEKGDIESRSRAENVRELRSSIMGYMQNHPEAQSLSEFLSEIALFTDLDELNESDDMPTLMTIHAAKGLEFPNVYIVGMEDGIFPGMQALTNQEDLEEERRLCYVAMTRAKKNLTMTCSTQRMLFGRTTSNRPSCFLSEIPEINCERLGAKRPASVRAEYDEEEVFTENRFADSGLSERGANRGAERAFKPRTPHFSRGATASGSRFAGLSLSRGDMVEHTAFGRGMVVSVQNVGNDALIEIAFDRVGTKRLMRNAASEYMTKIQ
ncbi:MAG: UvrD-helicase domain-containing protein [Oscillospiraceae bacterium]|nr:UvrD-helicase domain-containing protein [Oscillospiraceae bacterium]